MTNLSARCVWTDRGRVSPPRANVDKGSYGDVATVDDLQGNVRGSSPSQLFLV